jgi:hypothetical protein
MFSCSPPTDTARTSRGHPSPHQIGPRHWPLTPLLPPGPLPHNPRKPLQRHQRTPGIRPVPKLRKSRVIQRLPPRPARKQRSRNIHHMRRAHPLIRQRRAAPPAKTPHRALGLVLVPANIILAIDNPEPFAPGPDIGRIGRPMRHPARRRMIVPRPPCRKIDLQPHRPAKTSPLYGLRHLGPVPAATAQQALAPPPAGPAPLTPP